MPTTFARSTYLDHEARRRAIASLPAHKRLALEALFKSNPSTRVGIYSLRETAAAAGVRPPTMPRWESDPRRLHVRRRARAIDRLSRG